MALCTLIRRLHFNWAKVGIMIRIKGHILLVWHTFVTLSLKFVTKLTVKNEEYTGRSFEFPAFNLWPILFKCFLQSAKCSCLLDIDCLCNLWLLDRLLAILWCVWRCCTLDNLLFFPLKYKYETSSLPKPIYAHIAPNSAHFLPCAVKGIV